MEPIDVGFAKTALHDFKKAGRLQLLEICAHTSLPRANVFRKPLLTRKTSIVCPCVLEEHGVGHLAADGEFLVGQDEIRNLREPVPGNRISVDDLNRARDLIKASGNVLHVCIIAPSSGSFRLVHTGDEVPMLRRRPCLLLLLLGADEIRCLDLPGRAAAVRIDLGGP